MYLFESVFAFFICIYPVWETALLFSTVTMSVYILTNSIAYEGSPFSTLSPIFIICVLFDDSHSGRFEVISNVIVDLLFSDD